MILFILLFKQNNIKNNKFSMLIENGGGSIINNEVLLFPAVTQSPLSCCIQRSLQYPSAASILCSYNGKMINPFVIRLEMYYPRIEMRNGRNSYCAWMSRWDGNNCQDKETENNAEGNRNLGW